MQKNHGAIRKQEYARLLFSVRSIIFVVVMLSTTLVSYIFSHILKLELLQQLASNADDLNTDVLQAWINRYNGFEYFFTYYRDSDEFSIAILLLYAWIGIFVACNLARQKESGYGNWLVVRCGYRRYVKETLCAQAMYIATITAIVFVAQLILAFVLGGVQTLRYDFGSVEYGCGGCVLVVLATYGIITFFCVMTNTIAASCLFFVDRSNVIALIPVVVFAMFPLLLFSTIANVLNWPTITSTIFIPFGYLNVLYYMLNCFYPSYAIALVASMVLFGVLAWISVHISTRTMERDYR